MLSTTKRMRIGIPRALFYYNYYPLYETFFREMGCEVVVSDKTTKKLLEQGLNTSSNELCLPIKLLYGHVINLKEKSVDYIFIPYIISTQKGAYICPKLIGAPDMVKANIDAKLLSVDIDMHNPYSSMFSAFREIASSISTNPIKLYSAYAAATKAQEEFDKYIQSGMLFDDAIVALKAAKKKNPRSAHGKYKIAIIGHTYVFNDEYMSCDLFGKLKKRAVDIVTSDMLSLKQIEKALSKVERKTHWNLGNRVLASALVYGKSKDIDGIIYITPFSCSSDSLVKEYIDINSNGQKPFMTLTIDEHSADAGVTTRIEAFLDMLKR